MPNPSDDPVLQRFKAALQEIYGNRIERVVLFGSRARGAARDNSDYDVAVFFRDLPDVWKERLRLADLRVAFLDTTGRVLRCEAIPDGGLSRSHAVDVRNQKRWRGCMKIDSAALLDQADVMLTRPERMLSVGLDEDAARAAYLACFHVAQAYIFERTGRASKTHHGVQTEFFRLSRDDARADHVLRRFLSKSYEFKSVADYGVGPDAVISAEEATGAITTAKRFVSHFRSLVAIAIWPPSPRASVIDARSDRHRRQHHPRRA